MKNYYVLLFILILLYPLNALYAISDNTGNLHHVSLSGVNDFWSGSTIIIYENGTIFPSDAPIIPFNNVTYYITDDIYVEDGSCIIIYRSGIILDGRGHIVKGDGRHIGIGVKADNVVIKNTTIINNEYGIYLYRGSYNNIIKNNNISDCDHGISSAWILNLSIVRNNITNNKYAVYLAGLNHSIIRNNLINNEYGICLIGSRNNNIIGNYIVNNKFGILLDWGSNNNNIIDNVFVSSGLFIWRSHSNNITNNIVNGDPLIYLENKENIIIDQEAGQIILVNCRNITIINQNIVNTTLAIGLYRTNKTIVKNNNITSNIYGIYMMSSNNNVIESNNITSNRFSLYLWWSPNNNITRKRT